MAEAEQVIAPPEQELLEGVHAAEGEEEAPAEEEVEETGPKVRGFCNGSTLAVWLIVS